VDAHVFQAVTDAVAHFDAELTDPAGKDDKIHLDEVGGIGPNVSAYAVGIGIQRFDGVGISRFGGRFQVTQITGNSRKAQRPLFLLRMFCSS